MLICYHNRNALPRSNTIYVVFLMSALEAVADMEVFYDLDDLDDEQYGFLIEVPFLQVVPLPVQVDLLAETWARHISSDEIEATLLDAAVVYAACMTASRIVNDEPSLATSWLRHGTQSVDPRILKRLSQRLESIFDQWWDDHDFLMIEDFQDMPPEKARYIRTLMRVPEDMVQPMFDVLERGRVSPNLGNNLNGLLPPQDIDDVVALANRPRRKESSVEIFKGIEDRYHGLLVGPCGADTIDREIELPMVVEIGVLDPQVFDCSYSDWAQHIRELVLQAEQDSQCHESSDESRAGVEDRELEDGTRVERRESGWVVVDHDDAYLADIEYGDWVVGEDDDFPPLYFETREDAYRAYGLSRHLDALRTRRREDALRRLRE